MVGGKGKGKGKGRTTLNSITKLLPHSQHQHFLPKLLARPVLDPERPGSTMDISRILPNGLHAPFEEVDTIPHLQILQRQLIKAFPKRLDRDDGFE